MNFIRKYFLDEKTKKWIFYVVLTALLLYLTWILVNHLGAAAAVTGKTVSLIMSSLAPLWIGLLLAYLFNPFIDFLERTVAMKLVKSPSCNITGSDRICGSDKACKRRKMIAVIIAYLIIILIIILLIYGFVALILGQFVIKSIPAMFESLADIFGGYIDSIKGWAANIPSGILSQHATDIVDKLFGWIANSFSAQSILSAVNNITGSFVNFVIGLIISIYLSYDKERFIGVWNALLDRSDNPMRRITVNNTLNDVNMVVSTFLRGVLLDALIIAVISSVALTIMGLKFAVFIGIFAGICNVIPYFGPILGMIPAFIVGLFTSDIWHALLAVLILLVIQQLDGNVIYPKVVGSKTGLHPLLVLLSVYVAGYFWGLLGMVIAVPVTGVLKLFVLKWFNSFDKKRDARKAFAGMTSDDAEDGSKDEDNNEQIPE